MTTATAPDKGEAKKAPITSEHTMDFKTMKRDQLMDAFHALVVTAKELGVEFHSVKPEIPEQDLRNSCLALDARIILKRRAEDKAKRERGKKEAEAAKKAKVAGKKTEASRRGASDATAAPTSAESGEGQKNEDTDMARKTSKTTKSKARSAVKGKTKKAAGKRMSFDEKAKITLTEKDNPRREGSKKFKEFELLKKCSGKTVGYYLEQGGKARTLSSMIRRKWGKVA